jgi:hypothetical protein
VHSLLPLLFDIVLMCIANALISKQNEQGKEGDKEMRIAFIFR